MKVSEFFTGKRILLTILAVLIIGSSIAIYFKEKPKEKYVKASGTVEVTQVQLAPLAGGRIEELAIDESDHVKKGQFIARLSLDGAHDEVKMAEAALAAAKAQLEELRNGFRKEDVSKAKADLAARKGQ